LTEISPIIEEIGKCLVSKQAISIRWLMRALHIHGVCDFYNHCVVSFNEN
jgi:hypothetical protein